MTAAWFARANGDPKTEIARAIWMCRATAVDKIESRVIRHALPLSFLAAAIIARSKVAASNGGGLVKWRQHYLLLIGLLH